MEYILIFVALILVYLVMMYNSIVHAEMKVEESRSGIDVVLAKRYAILTNMQESVKGYVKHEKEVLQQITQIRRDMTLQQLGDVNEQMNQLKRQLFALAESYPELKANENFSRNGLRVLGFAYKEIAEEKVIGVEDEYDYTFVWMSDTQYYSESYPYIYKRQTECV